MYADTMTDSMRRAIDETNRRRNIQNRYNQEHGIVPRTVVKPIVNTLEISKKVEENKPKQTKKDIVKEIERLTAAMKVAAAGLDFEMAIRYREDIAALKRALENKE